MCFVFTHYNFFNFKPFMNNHTYLSALDDSTSILTRLLDWCDDNGGYGLTITYIVGIIRYNSGNNEFSIEDLFNEFSKTEEAYKISFCCDLDEYIFGKFKKEDAPVSYYHNFKNIFYTSLDFELKLNHQEDLIKFFENIYSSKLNNHLYSKDYYTHQWRTLTEKEISFF